jgi:hypothetical protein
MDSWIHAQRQDSLLAEYRMAGKKKYLTVIMKGISR